MPAVGGSTLRGRLNGSWRNWTALRGKTGGVWKDAKYAFVFRNGEWFLIWATSASLAINESATVETDNTITIAWEADDPEAVQSYTVKRADGSVVATVPAGGSPYSVTDSTPLPGSNAYTITSSVADLPDGNVTTGAVGIDLSVDSVSVVFDSDPAPNRSAVVTWTGEKPNTSAFQVYGPTGAWIGTVSAGTLTFTHNNPPANISGGVYTVEAIDYASQGHGSVDSNSVTIAVAPPSASVSDTGPIDVAAGVDIDWSAVVGEHTGFQVSALRSCGSVTTTVTAAEDAVTTSIVPAAASAGGTTTFSVRSMINGALSAPTVAGVVAWNPNVPTAVSAVADGTVGRLKLSWGAPTNGCVVGYEVQADDGGWIDAGTDTISPDYYTWSGTSGTRSMRIRSLGANGGVSAWVTVTATPTWDVTPPGNVNITSFKPESSYGRLVVRFTTSSSDNYQYLVQRSINDGAWTNVTGWTNTGNSQAKSHVVVTGSSGNKYEVRVLVRDVFLNQGTGGAVYYTLKPATQTIASTGINHYRQGQWNYSGNGYAYQGYYSTSSYQYYGFLFFGNNLIQNACNASSSFGGKISVQSMKVRGLERAPGIGNYQVACYLGTHAKSSASGSVSTSTIGNVSNMGTIDNQGQSADFTLTAAQRNALRDSADGLGLEYFGTTYMALDNCDDIQIVSLG